MVKIKDFGEIRLLKLRELEYAYNILIKRFSGPDDGVYMRELEGKIHVYSSDTSQDYMGGQTMTVQKDQINLFDPNYFDFAFELCKKMERKLNRPFRIKKTLVNLLKDYKEHHQEVGYYPRILEVRDEG